MAPKTYLDIHFSSKSTLANFLPRRSSRPSFPRLPTLRWCATRPNRSSGCVSYANPCPTTREDWIRISLEISVRTSIKRRRTNCSKINKTVNKCDSALLSARSRMRKRRRSRYQGPETVTTVTMTSAWVQTANSNSSRSAEAGALVPNTTDELATNWLLASI